MHSNPGGHRNPDRGTPQINELYMYIYIHIYCIYGIHIYMNTIIEIQKYRCFLLLHILRKSFRSRIFVRRSEEVQQAMQLMQTNPDEARRRWPWKVGLPPVMVQ